MNWLLKELILCFVAGEVVKAWMRDRDVACRDLATDQDSGSYRYAIFIRIADLCDSIDRKLLSFDPQEDTHSCSDSNQKITMVSDAVLMASVDVHLS